MTLLKFLAACTQK